MIFISLVFLIPIWRIACSKGYSGKAFVLWAAIPSALAVAVDVILKPESETATLVLLALELGVPLSVLVVAAVLRSRPGAPGKEWHKIRFPCPDCGAALEFSREEEGLVRQCPKCKEIVTVRDQQVGGVVVGSQGRDDPD